MQRANVVMTMVLARDPNSSESEESKMTGMYGREPEGGRLSSRYKTTVSPIFVVAGLESGFSLENGADVADMSRLVHTVHTSAQLQRAASVQTQSHS